MARFYGTVQGQRGGASRLGHTSSGLTTRANGWGGGVTVRLYDVDGADHAEVTLTNGSGNAGRDVTLYRGPIDAETRERLRQEQFARAPLGWGKVEPGPEQGADEMPTGGQSAGEFAHSQAEAMKLKR